MAKAAIVLITDLPEDADGTDVQQALATMVDAVRAGLGDNKKGVAMYAAIQDKADDVEALFDHLKVD